MISAIYIAGFLLVFQAILPYMFVLNSVYHYRIDYQIFKDNPQSIDVVLDKLAREVNGESSNNYVILLGDSVAYSSPQSSDNSLARFLRDISHKQGQPDITVYNLAAPSMQAGDICTMLLKLDERGISTQNVMINLRYAGFVKRQPGPSVVFWLQDDLKQLDPAAFQAVLPHLQQAGYRKKAGATAVRDFMDRHVLNLLPMYRYKDFILTKLSGGFIALLKGTQSNDALGDVRPWHVKKGLAEFLQRPEYVNGFNPEPFDLTEANPHIYFWQKIFAHQQNTHTLVFLTGTNEELAEDYVEASGYQANLRSIDAYFQDKPVDYINLQGTIPPGLFTDHTHFTSEGYRQLAGLLWDRWNR